MTSKVDPMRTGGERVMTLDELNEFGASLGRALIGWVPKVVALRGDLGTGKTTLTRAIARGFGVEEPVTSPTFALVHEYLARHGRQLFHLDLYRIKATHELANIGWESLLEAQALIIIEWPDRAGDLVPSNALAITLDYVEGDESRRLVTW